MNGKARKGITLCQLNHERVYRRGKGEGVPP